MNSSYTYSSSSPKVTPLQTLGSQGMFAGFQGAGMQTVGGPVISPQVDMGLPPYMDNQNIYQQPTIATPKVQTYGQAIPTNQIGPQQGMITQTPPITQISGPTLPPGTAPIDFEQLGAAQPVFDVEYTQGYLAQHIGEKVKVEFLIGTDMFVDREGTLLDVGISYIIINETETDDLLLCDIYSIKFVRFYR